MAFWMVTLSYEITTLLFCCSCQLYRYILDNYDWVWVAFDQWDDVAMTIMLITFFSSSSSFFWTLIINQVIKDCRRVVYKWLLPPSPPNCPSPWRRPPPPCARRRRPDALVLADCSILGCLIEGNSIREPETAAKVTKAMTSKIKWPLLML